MPHPNTALPLIERFEAFFEKSEGCWLWKGTKYPFGYGKFKIKGRWFSAHRISYELYKGVSPGELFVCHKCDVPACVNPDHFFLGTSEENFADMYRKGRNVNTPPKDNPCSRRGSENISARLTEQDVLKIRELIASGQNSRRIAQSFGVSYGAISGIKQRRTWSWLRP